MINRYINTQQSCPANIYSTSNFSTCNPFSVRQVLDIPPKSSIHDHILPILSLRIKDLCFLHERNDSNLTPYSGKACDVFAEGIATELNMQYLPMKDKNMQAHLLWITNNTIKWVELTHKN